MGNKINFVVVELCDNDFGHDLYEGLRSLVDEACGIDFCPFIAKEYIVEYVVSAHKRKTILRGKEGYSDPDSIKNYIERIRVTFREKLPTYDIAGEYPIDHEMGSVYYDVNLDEVFFLSNRS